MALRTGGARNEQGRRLRLLVHDYGGYSFIEELARELARRGHWVHHVHYASLRSGKGALSRLDTDPDTLTFTGLTVGAEFDRYRPMDRLRLERRYANELASVAREWGPDVVLASNTPLLVLHWLRPQLAQAGVPLVNWLQDLHSIAMGEDLGRRAGAAARPAGWAMERVESRLLRRCAAVIAITADFLPMLRQWSIPEDRVHVIQNWAELRAPAPRHNAFSAEHGLDGRVTLLYAGTLGLKHEPHQLVALAEAFRDRPDVALVVVTEGIGRARLEQEKQSRDLANLVLVDFQPPGRVPEMLATGDVLLSMVRPEAGRFSVPSKVLGYLVAGRAQLASIPPENLSARIVEESGGGLVVRPGDEGEWLAAARRLVDDTRLRDTLGRQGRAYAEAHFDVGSSADRIEAVLAGAAVPHRP
ncbi:MAG: glycosyltransferase family 4 protein [Acidimicrobiales bacterium]